MPPAMTATDTHVRFAVRIASWIPGTCTTGEAMTMFPEPVIATRASCPVASFTVAVPVGAAFGTSESVMTRVTV